MSDLLVFVEDPGAVNVIAPVLAKLPAGGAHVLSAGHATDLMRKLGFDPQVVPDGAAAVDIVRKDDPACVVVGTSENPRSPALSLIEEGRTAGRTTIGVVDFAANAAFRFRGESDHALTYAPDWLLVPDSWTAKEYERLGFPAERIRVVGHPHFDTTMAVRERLESAGRAALRARLLPDAGGRKVIVFVSEISTGLDPAQYRRSKDYTLAGRGRHDGRTEIVIEELLDAVSHVANERPYLVLRRHPKETADNLVGLAESFDHVSSGGDPLELLFAADLAVGMSSMLLMEAFLLGVPVLSILPRAVEAEWLPITRSGAVPVATNRAALRGMLERLLAGDQRDVAAAARPDIRPGAADRILEFVQQFTPHLRMAT